jgi:nitroreductase
VTRNELLACRELWLSVSGVEFRDVVRKRRMVHVFENRPVEPDVVDRLLDVARRGPSAGFSQGSDFLVLDDPATLARFWELTEDPRFPYEPGELEAAPPVLVVALADAGRYIERYSRPDKIAFGLDRADAWPVKFWDTDTAMACMLLLLAAVDAGLGGWYFGIPHGEAEFRREFEIPDDRNVIGVVGLGHAGVEERPRGSVYSLARRPLHEMVHRNGW